MAKVANVAHVLASATFRLLHPPQKGSVSKLVVPQWWWGSYGQERVVVSFDHIKFSHFGW